MYTTRNEIASLGVLKPVMYKDAYVGEITAQEAAMIKEGQSTGTVPANATDKVKEALRLCCGIIPGAPSGSTSPNSVKSDSSQKPAGSFAITSGTQPPPEEPKKHNWLLIGGIAGGSLLILTLVVILSRKKKV